MPQAMVVDLPHFDLEAALLKKHPAKPANDPSRPSRFSVPVITFLTIAVAFTCVFTLFNTNILVQKTHKLHESHRVSDRRAEEEHAVVAADDGRCSVAGRNILRKGGHAIDATVATALCLGVVHSMSSGIGGGSFMLLRLANGQAEAYDMRETAPAAATEDIYAIDPSKMKSGPLSVGVPGELAGLHLAWQKFGRLPWKQLFEPAISLANKGFEVSPYLGMLIKKYADSIMADEGLQKVFAPKGYLLQTGDKCYQKTLAESLKAIAEFGPSIFYNGTVGEKLIGDLQAKGGIMTIQDLHHYRVKVQNPLSADVMGYKILGMPPPSSGGAGLILIFNIIANYRNSSAMQDVLGLHRTIEAVKHMFAVRMNLGDPDFVNSTDALADIVSPQFATELWQTIYDNMTFEASYYGGKWDQLRDHGTSHFGIVDSDRNAVSMTTTVNSYFGAKILSVSTGILLNNEMADFSVPGNNPSGNLPAAMTNCVQPNKRPLSSMCPTILLENGQLRGVLGASGGMMIIPATAEVLINAFLKGMDASSSLNAARVYPELLPNIVKYENWTTVNGEHIELSKEIRDGLEAIGHKLQGITSGGAVSQLIVHDIKASANTTTKGVHHGKLIAACDPRKDGEPAGY